MIKAVVFDAFGTVCRITQKRNPYGKLFRQLEVDAVDARRRALTEPLDFCQFAALLAGGKTDEADEAAEGVLPGLFGLPGLLEDLQVERDSIEAFPEAIEVMTELRRRGYRLVIASNLAQPYGGPVRKLFGDFVDSFVFSFEVGAAKPEAAIFQEVQARLDIPPSELLMVGDSEKNDYEGAQAFGMNALRLTRGAAANNYPSIVDLRAVLDYPALG